MILTARSHLFEKFRRSQRLHQGAKAALQKGERPRRLVSLTGPKAYRRTPQQRHHLVSQARRPGQALPLVKATE